MNHHVFSSGILIEEDIDLKQNDLQLNLVELINIEDADEKELIDLMKEEQKISSKPLDIVDVEKKYKLKRIQKKNKFFGTLFGSFSSVLTMVVIIIIGILTYRCVRNKTKPTDSRGNALISFNTTPDRKQLTSTPNTTTTSVDSDEDGVEIRLFSTPAASNG